MSSASQRIYWVVGTTVHTILYYDSLSHKMCQIYFYNRLGKFGAFNNITVRTFCSGIFLWLDMHAVNFSSVQQLNNANDIMRNLY